MTKYIPLITQKVEAVEKANWDFGKLIEEIGLQFCALRGLKADENYELFSEVYHLDIDENSPTLCEVEIHYGTRSTYDHEYGTTFVTELTRDQLIGDYLAVVKAEIAAEEAKLEAQKVSEERAREMRYWQYVTLKKEFEPEN